MAKINYVIANLPILVFRPDFNLDNCLFYD